MISVRKTIILFLLAISYISFSQEIIPPDTLNNKAISSDTLHIHEHHAHEDHTHEHIPSSKDSLKVSYIYLHEYRSEKPAVYANDTTLTYSQQQDPAFSGMNFYQTLGNQGLATKNMLFEATDALILDYGIHSNSLYQTTPYNLKAFQSYKPYTILDYSQGPSGDRREAQLNVDHGQYLAKNLGVGAKLYMNSSLGDYDRQKAQNFQVAFHGRFKSESERYAIAAAYINNNTTWYDNGGIKYDSVFEQNLEPNRKLILVNRSDASTEIRDVWVYASQYFYLLSPENYNVSLGKFGMDTYYNRSKYQYWDEDPDTLRYPAFFSPDPTNTFDSTSVTRIMNDLYWTSSKAGKERLLNIKGGVIVQNMAVHHHDTVSYQLNWLTTYGEISLNPDSVTSVWAKVALTAGTNAAENFLLQGTAKRKFSFGNLNASVKAYNSDPGFALLNMYSSHYKWNLLGFKDIRNFEMGINFLNDKNTQGGIRYNTVYNHTYLDQSILPAQESSSIHLLRAWVTQDFSLWKIDFSAKAVYQYVSNRDIIRLPEFMGKLSFQFYQPMFDNALYTRIGFDVLYTSGFYGDAYAPALKQFYLQDTKKTGNYPFVDAYIKLQVKRARIFVMFTHVNSGLLGYDYYLTPHYPMKDRYLKYGVSWFFHD